MGLIWSGWMNRVGAELPASPSSCFLHLAVPTSTRLSVILNSAPVAPGDSRSRWSSSHRSPHLQLSACRQEVSRVPVEQSSDGVRAECGVRSGMHVWEVLWDPGQRGSHAVVGVSGQSCPVQAPGYSVLVGRDSQSWGWELNTNQRWHGGETLGVYPDKRKRWHSQEARCSASSRRRAACGPPGSPLLVPKRVLLLLDADAGTVGYVVDGLFLGVAFRGLPRGVELYPAVSSVRGGAVIRLRYLNGDTRSPPALMALCRLTICRTLGEHRHHQTDRLPLPPPLQQCLLPSL